MLQATEWLRRLSGIVPLALAALSLTLLSLTLLGLAILEHITAPAAWLLLGMVLAAALAAGWFLYRLDRYLLEPLLHLEQRVRGANEGESPQAMGQFNVGVLGELVRDIAGLGEELIQLYNDMDDRVARQTLRLAQKTAVLNILYDAAATINQSTDIDELLLRFLRIFKEMINGRTASVRIRQADGGWRLAGAIGPDDELLRGHELLPLPLCSCGQALSPADILCPQHPKPCSQRRYRTMLGAAELAEVVIPLACQGEELGFFRILMNQPGLRDRDDVRAILTAMGRQLGIALAKQRSDCAMRRLALMEERSSLSQELHDSLAQTLAGLKFQVRMLEESLAETALPGSIAPELRRLSATVHEAHGELRSLLASFRAPLGAQGLLDAMERLIQRLRDDTGMVVLLQRECSHLELSSLEEIQLTRILQEALHNIRKHAKARAVRVLLRCTHETGVLLLIEDDGAGFEPAQIAGAPGEHLGLSIMRERAERLGGRWKLETEPDEGTRIELTFRPGAGAARASIESS